MSSGSVHDKLNRVRKPRVHIRYDVETEGAQVVVDLPFVVGVLGDFSGKSTKPLEPLSKRKFISIDRDSFNGVMARISPGAEFRVANTLKGDNTEFPVKLQFNSIEDFEPERVVAQVESLRALKETRDKLRDLNAKVDRSDALEGLLEKILNSEDDLKKLQSELGVKGTGDAPEAKD